MGCHFLLQGIFLTQGSNLGLLHCKWILYCLCHQGSLDINAIIDSIGKLAAPSYFGYLTFILKHIDLHSDHNNLLNIMKDILINI